jgi:hypothetical protein
MEQEVCVSHGDKMYKRADYCFALGRRFVVVTGGVGRCLAVAGCCPLEVLTAEARRPAPWLVDTDSADAELKRRDSRRELDVDGGLRFLSTRSDASDGDDVAPPVGAVVDADGTPRRE